MNRKEWCNQGVELLVSSSYQNGSLEALHHGGTDQGGVLQSGLILLQLLTGIGREQGKGLRAVLRTSPGH